MLNSISSFEIILVLFPGFLTSLVKNGLIITKEKTDVDKIVEGLAFNLCDYVIFRIGIYFLSLLGLHAGNMFDVVFILVIAVFNGIIIAVILDKEWLYEFLREKLKVTHLTGRLAVWNDVFSKYRGKWILIHLIDGRQIIGWPKYYSEEPNNKEIFLVDATWMKDNGEFIDVEGPGILITGDRTIKLVEILE